tara:strand:+ start:92 stop:781 length:690 start_codon:yes stop_codon:yes gene_type:complete
MDEIVCDDCGDVVEKEDDLNEVWSKFSEKNVKICSECLKTCCKECGDVWGKEDDLNEDGYCPSCLIEDEDEDDYEDEDKEKTPQEWLDEWYSGTKYKLIMNDEDYGCVIATVENAGDYETQEINLNYGDGAENSMEFRILAQSFWSEFDEENFDETVASLDCTWDELVSELNDCLPRNDWLSAELWTEDSPFSILVEPDESISLDELPTLKMMNDCFRQMKEIFDSHKK